LGNAAIAVTHRSSLGTCRRVKPVVHHAQLALPRYERSRR
jgi:hypothetical protein